MNPLTMFQIILQATASIPKVVEAIQTIMASDAAHTIESAFEAWFHHNTAGGTNAPALGPDAPKLEIPVPLPVVNP